MITFENVTKKFPDGTEALKGVSVTIPTNQLTAIIGPSGCGKTTFMRMINRLEAPTSGEIFIDGEPIAERDEIDLRRSIGYVIQRIGLIPHMTIEQNIALVPELLNWDRQQIHERVDELLRMVELDPAVFKERYPKELSGGQQQRVGVSRALASNPNIILMDEPFSALDPISREQLQERLKALQKEIQKTIVFVTHDMDEALEIADHVIIMRDGQIEQMGSPQSLIREPKNEFVKTFIGEERMMRQLEFDQMQLSHVAHYFLQTIEEDVGEVRMDETIADAIEQLKTGEHEQLAVVSDGKILGYVNYAVLLDALMSIKGGASVK